MAADGFADEPQAKRWLEGACKDEERREAEVEAALRSVNRAIHAQRVSTADPYVHEVSRPQALQARLGYGSGDELVEGRWQAATVLPPPHRRGGRRQMLSPQEEVAGILSGRSPSYASEDLLLRARLDLDQGRGLQAALQLRTAIEALDAELLANGASAENAQLVSLRDRAAAVRALATKALRGDLDEEHRAALWRALQETEQILRRRRHAQDR